MKKVLTGLGVFTVGFVCGVSTKSSVIKEAGNQIENFKNDICDKFNDFKDEILNKSTKSKEETSSTKDEYEEETISE